MTDNPPLFSHYPSHPPPMKTRLVELPERPCPYLEGRQARERALFATRIDGDSYRDFVYAGFRRSGRVIYQPVCSGCRECVPLRVVANDFVPSDSQKRVWKRNRDLAVEVGKPVLTDEALAVYQRYVTQWHGDEAPTRDELDSFLYDSPTDSAEFRYRDPGGVLMGVGICDLSRSSLSSVYFFFEPAYAKRSLGTFAALYELEFARQERLTHYYLGYYVRGCSSMSYKANFRPFELLGTDGIWRRG